MTKTQLISDFALGSAPQEIQDELTELMADMPEELSEDMIKQIITYATAAQDRENEFASVADEAATAAETYVQEVDDALEAEDVEIADTLRTTMQAAQNIAS